MALPCAINSHSLLIAICTRSHAATTTTTDDDDNNNYTVVYIMIALELNLTF